MKLSDMNTYPTRNHTLTVKENIHASIWRPGLRAFKTFARIEYGLAVLLSFGTLLAFAQTTPSQTYNSTTTHNFPAGVTKVTVQVWGGGAAGAGSTGDTGGGSGGGGGGYTKAVI